MIDEDNQRLEDTILRKELNDLKKTVIELRTVNDIIRQELEKSVGPQLDTRIEKALEAKGKDLEMAPK